MNHSGERIAFVGPFIDDEVAQEPLIDDGDMVQQWKVGVDKFLADRNQISESQMVNQQRGSCHLVAVHNPEIPQEVLTEKPLLIEESLLIQRSLPEEPYISTAQIDDYATGALVLVNIKKWSGLRSFGSYHRLVGPFTSVSLANNWQDAFNPPPIMQQVGAFL